MIDASGAPPRPESNSAWQRFWFVNNPQEGSLQAVRIGLSAIAIWYFASHWSDIGQWFSSEGLLATEQLGRLIEAEGLVEQFKYWLSPLYWLESTAGLRAFLVVGMALAVAAGTVRRTRIPSVLLWLWCVWLANRSLVIAGPEELTLVFGLAYVAIASPNNPRHWTTASAKRLLQVHTTMLIGFSGLTMLSSIVWWDGTGSMAVAAPIGRRLLDLTSLLSNLWVQSLLTHVIVFTAILAPIALWFRPTRRPALIALLIWCLLMALLSSQWMYMATVAVLLQTFSPQRV